MRLGLAARMILAAVAVSFFTAFVSLNAAIVYFERRIDTLPPEVSAAVDREVLRNAAPDFDGLPEFALAVVVSALLGSTVGVAVALPIARPVTAVAAAARRVAAGDLGARVGGQASARRSARWVARSSARSGGHSRRRRRNDEVGRLVADFNAMADGLSRLEAERRTTAAALAHELRTPVAVLQARLEAARDGVLSLDRAVLSGLVDQTRLLARLIDDLKTLSLADAGQLAVRREPVDLGALVGSTARGFETAADAAGIQLVVHSGDPAAAPDGPAAAPDGPVSDPDGPVSDPDGPVSDPDGPVSAPDGPLTVLGDPDRLAQLVGNLLDNAIRYTPSGGVVEVAVAVTDGRCRVTVTDTGPGIDDDERDRVFERFTRGAAGMRHSGGSGQGLAIARAIAVAHGGSLALERSGDGTGARFAVDLPVGAHGRMTAP